MKEQLKEEQLEFDKKSMAKVPKTTISQDIVVLNKVKNFLEGRLGERKKDDKTRGYIQNQLAFLQSRIDEKSTKN